MARQRSVEVADQRDASPKLRWLTLHTPDLARDVRAGQYLLVRCSAADTHEPWLRRALFVAAAQPALGQIGVLYEASSDAGLGWLGRARAGDALDIIGPLGKPFGLAAGTRTLLLIGSGAGLGALLLLAAEALARGASATLLAAAAEPALLPPAFLIPDEIEYQSVIGQPAELYSAQQLVWADQIGAALAPAQVPALRDAVRAARVRPGREFARVLLAGPVACGVGACGICALTLRGRTRLLCVDGPVVDLRDLAEVA
jgi:dihydroorotate dehydrogenase electron transfer subunit